MLGLLRKKRLELYPKANEGLHEGVYNRWKSSFLGKKDTGEDWYAAMSETIEYFVLTEIDDSKTHVVRVMKDVDDSTRTRFSSNYSDDSKIFAHPVAQVTASDVTNAYPLSDFEKRYSKPRDQFGLRRVGTLDEFVQKMNSGRL